jgi:hypothetical protein
VSALEKPNQNYRIEAEPAKMAGIFLSEHISRAYPVPEMVAEAVAKVISLNRAGRLLGQTATPGEVTVYAAPDSSGNF